MRTLRPVLAVVVMAAAVAFSLAGGAGSGSGATTDPCPPELRPAVLHHDHRHGAPSRHRSAASSPTCSTRSSVDNVGGATLTNGVVTATLNDHVGTTTSKVERAVHRRRLDVWAAPRSRARRTPSRATSATSPPGSRARRSSSSTGHRRRPDVDSTDATVVGSFKEKGNDNQNNDPNPDTRPVVEKTTYEPCPTTARTRGRRTTSSVKLGDRARRGHVGIVLVHEPWRRRHCEARRVRRPSSADHCVSGRTCFGQVDPHGRPSM